MKKRPTKAQTIASKLSAAETEALKQQQLLRRLRNQQRAITSLARELTRAVKRADLARLLVARELCVDTGWGVFEIREVKQRAENAERAAENANQLLLRIEELQNEREAAHV